MICCVIAAFLYAQALAVLRRWGLYWGVVRPDIGETGYSTFAGSVRTLLARPLVCAGVGLLMIAELGGVAAWLYTDHWDHVVGIMGIASAAQAEHSPTQIRICSASDSTLMIAIPNLPQFSARQLIKPS